MDGVLEGPLTTVKPMDELQEPTQYNPPSVTDSIFRDVDGARRLQTQENNAT